MRGVTEAGLLAPATLKDRRRVARPAHGAEVRGRGCEAGAAPAILVEVR
jgi:hypothetical protein